ncbi:MAG: ATP-binding protein [Bradymonadia bacterium]
MSVTHTANGGGTPGHEAPWTFYGQRAPLIGRVKELHRLREALRNTAESCRRKALLIMGPTGIGKSRLMAEFAETAEAHVDPVNVVSVACRPDGGPPYTIFRRFLEQRYYIDQDAPIESARAQFLAGVTQTLRDEALGEEAAHFIGHLVGLRFPRSKQILSVDADPRRIEARAVELLHRVMQTDAQKAPLLVTIDNLHLASDESIALLLTLAEGLKDSPIMFVGAGRRRLVERHRAFTETFKKRNLLLELSPLADRHCKRILEALLTRAAPLPSRFTGLTCEKAMGNPLSLEQIVHLHIEQGVIDVSGDAWHINTEALGDAQIPSSLRDVVRSKLARLGRGERRLLEKAAAVGEVFWSGAVDMLRRMDEGERWDEGDRYWRSSRRADEMGGLLEALRRKEIILRNPRSGVARSKEYAFKHILERELLYEGIEGPRRARYHRLIAQWLETHLAGHSEDLTELIAMHWERGHHPRKAATYYVQAGTRAAERHLNSKAVQFFNKSLTCLNEDDAVVRIDVFHKLGQAQMATSTYDEALGCFQEMLRLAWRLDDPTKGGLAYNKMGQCYRALGEYDLAVEHFETGLTLFRTVDDQRGIAMSADDMGRVHWLKGDHDEAMVLYEEGLRLRRVQGDVRSVAVSQAHLGSLYIEKGRFKEAVEILREALLGARQATDRRTEGDVLNSLAIICFHRGEQTKALALWQEAMQIAQLLGERQLQGMLLNNLGETELALGEVKSATERLTAAVELLEQVGDRRSLSDALRNLGSAYLRLDDYANALEYSQQALEVAEELGARAYAGLAERNLGEVYSRTLFDGDGSLPKRIEAAAQHFEASIGALRTVGHEAELGRSLLAHGAFLAEIGQFEEARARLEEARTLFTRLRMKDCLQRTERVLDAL